jgi:hypothetical protein
MMANNKDQKQEGKQDVRDQGGQSRQDGGPGSGGGAAQQSNDGSQHSSFLHSTPEANVFPAGKPQADHSGRGGGGHSAAGTPDEGRLGGSGGTSAAGTTGNDPDR